MPYKHDDHTPAINLIDAQLGKINAQAVFARELERLEMIRVLHAVRAESGNGKILDLELLLNQIGGIFKPGEESPETTIYYKRQCRLKFAKRIMRIGAQPHMIVMGQKKNKESRSSKPESSDISKLTQVVFDLNAEMGSMRKAMTRAGISFDKSPNKQKRREQAADGKQRGKLEQ